MGNRFLPTALRVIAAVLVLAGGAIHLQLWLNEYRDVPSDVEGAVVVNPGFLVSAVVSLVLALAVLFVRRPIVWLLALLFELASIVALALSRQASLLGWTEDGWDGDAKRTIAVEILAALALVVLLAVDYARSGRRTRPATA